MATDPDAETDPLDRSHCLPIDAAWTGPLRAHSARCSVPPRGAEASAHLRAGRISRPIARVGRLGEGRHPESVQNTRRGICACSSGRPNRIFGPAVRGFQLWPMGLMQLKPSTFFSLRGGNPFGAENNIAAGTEYLRQLIDRFKGSYRLAVSAYNAGPGVVGRCHCVPNNGETPAYVARVSFWYRKYNGQKRF